MHPKKIFAAVYSLILASVLIFGSRWACNSYVEWTTDGRFDSAYDLLKTAWSED